MAEPTSLLPAWLGLIWATWQIWMSANLRYDYLTVTWLFGFFWGVYLLLLGILGFFETVLIKWLIGLNEGKLEPETFSVTLDFAAVRDIILKEFSDSFELRVERNESDLLVVRTGGKWRVVMGIGPDRADSSKSILCLVPYEYGFYEISTTNEARKLRNDVLLNLQGRLVDKAKVTPTNDDPIVTTTTHAVAIQPTLTKYALTKELWQKIPTGFKYALAALAWVLITILFEEQSMLKTTIEFSTYLELTVLLFLAAVVAYCIPLDAHPSDTPLVPDAQTQRISGSTSTTCGNVFCQTYGTCPRL